MIKIPNPGSKEALKLQCECPVLDNAHGKGSGWGKDTFWVNGECPLHSVSEEKARKFIGKLAMKKIGL
jgi:hypothetical protein